MMEKFAIGIQAHQLVKPGAIVLVVILIIQVYWHAQSFLVITMLQQANVQLGLVTILLLKLLAPWFGISNNK